MSEESKNDTFTSLAEAISTVIRNVHNNHPNGLSFYSVMEASQFKILELNWQFVVEKIRNLEKEILAKTEILKKLAIQIEELKQINNSATKEIAELILKNESLKEASLSKKKKSLSPKE